MGEKKNEYRAFGWVGGGVNLNGRTHLEDLVLEM
jgi:hypothetical protein